MDSNPTTYQPGWPSCVIAGGYQTGVVAMRNLMRRGVPVCCIDCDPSMTGFNEVYGPAYECPNPDQDGAAWLQFMVMLAKKLTGQPVLIPSSDRFVLAIARHSDELSKAYRINLTSALIGQLSEKVSQYELAGKYGMPIPRTEPVRCEKDLEQFASVARFPCLLKPMTHRDWDVFPVGHPLHLAKIATAQNADELMKTYELVKEASPLLVVQEIIDGPDTSKVIYFSCYGQSGERIGSAVFKELRCAPPIFGSGSIIEPLVDEETDRVCDAFLRKIGCRGICEIELKRDSRSGKLMMIEANPRLSISGDATTHVGVDLPWLHYLDLAGIRVHPVGQNGRSVRHVTLRRDVTAIRDGIAMGLFTWVEVIKTYRPPLAFFDFSLREWKHSSGTLDYGVRAVAGPLYRRFFPKKN